MIKYLKNKRNLWDSSHNSKTLASYLPLESLLTSVHKRRCVCPASISSQSCVNRRELRTCMLMWLITLITSCKMSLSSGDIFWPTCTVHRLTFRSELFDTSSETRKPSSHGSTLCIYQHKMTNSVFLICNHSKT